MSRFNRSSHTRTNRFGTTFHVSGHQVNRDENAVQPQIQRPFRADSPNSGSLLCPNASCPICGASVWYFETKNGGKVFFDTAWPDWDKHPCTISDPPPRARDPNPVSNTSKDLPVLEVFPRASGTTLALRDGLDRRWFKGDIPVGQKYFAQVWPVEGSDGVIEAITMLSSDIVPKTIRVVPSDAPEPISEDDRLAFAKKMAPEAIALAKKIPGLSRANLVKSEYIGPFVGGMVGRSQLAVVPFLFDQYEEHSNPWRRTSYASSAIPKSMAKAAILAHRILASALKNEANPEFANRTIFLREGAMVEVQGEEDYLWEQIVGSDGEVDTSFYKGWSYTELDAARIGSIHLIESGQGMPEAPVELRSTVDMLIAYEDAWCKKHWPHNLVGQWQQAEAMAKKLALGDLFKKAHQFLIDRGWTVFYAYYTSPRGGGVYVNETSRFDFEPGDNAPGKAKPLRLMFGLSGSQGLTFLIDRGDQSAGSDRLLTVKSADDFEALFTRACS